MYIYVCIYINVCICIDTYTEVLVYTYILKYMYTCTWDAPNLPSAAASLGGHARMVQALGSSHRKGEKSLERNHRISPHFHLQGVKAKSASLAVCC